MAVSDAAKRSGELLLACRSNAQTSEVLYTVFASTIGLFVTCRG